jgi:hypothetical protein
MPAGRAEIARKRFAYPFSKKTRVPLFLPGTLQ